MDPDGFFASVGPRSGDSQGDVITFTYNVNTGIARSARLLLVATGRTAGQASEEFLFEQNAAAPTIALTTTSLPEVADLAMIPAEPGGATGKVEVTIDLGGGATTWRIGRAGGARSTFIESFTPKSGDRTNNILTIVYNRNTRAQRLADFAISTNGTPPAAKGLRLIQLAAAPSIAELTAENTVSKWYGRFSLSYRAFSGCIYGYGECDDYLGRKRDGLGGGEGW